MKSTFVANSFNMNKYLFFILFSFLYIVSCDESQKNNESYTINEEASNEKTGLSVYQERCVSCHGIDGTLGFSGAKNLKESIKKLDEIASQVRNGKGAMNPFKNILSPSEIDSVSHYVLTLHKK